MPSTLIDPRSDGIAVNTEQVRSDRVDVAFLSTGYVLPRNRTQTSVEQAFEYTLTVSGIEDDS